MEEYNNSLSALVSGEYEEGDIKVVRRNFNNLVGQEKKLLRKMEKEKNEYVRKKGEREKELREIRKDIKEVRKILGRIGK